MRRAGNAKRGLTLGGLVAAVVAATIPMAHAAPTGLSSCTGTNWPMFGHDIGRSFASPDTCISNVNAATLAPKWFFNTGSPVSAQPTVVDGVVYVGDFAGIFHAVDASNGTQLWSFDATRYDNDQTDYGRIPDSAAVATIGKAPNEKKVVVFGGGDTLFVLDTAGEHTLLAHQCVDRVDPTCQGGAGHTSEIESSPVIVPHIDNRGSALVIVGNDDNEHDPGGPEGMIAFVLGPNGSLTPKWQFDPELGVSYAGLAPLDPSQSEHGCGDVWSSPSIDITHGVRKGVVVFGTGNCNNPQEVSTTATTRPVESTFAVSLLTGNLLWQQSPHPVANGLDLDFGATPNMLGAGLVGEGGKDGVYYAYNLGVGPPVPPATASPAWSTDVTTASDIGGMIGSTAVGRFGAMHNTDQAIFAASAIPVSDIDPPGSIANDVEHPTQAFGVHAVDAITHRVVWDAPVGAAYGAAVFDNGVVFVPDTFTDSLLALDADTGAVLRDQPLDAPPSSPVAISGNSVYMGAGTTETSPPLNTLGSFGGIWGFETTP